MKEITPSERGCYCGLWDTSPDTLEQQKLPRGYCGLCDVCGKPGHTRHFPGTSPTTGSWCDRHYTLVKTLHPLGAVGCYLWRGLLIAVVAGFVLWRNMPKG